MKFKQKYIILICSIFLLNIYSYSQNPKKNWKRYKHVEQSGFSIEKLDIAKKYYDSLNSSAFMIIQNGNVVAE